MEFSNLKLKISGSYNGSDVYELTKKDESLLAQHYFEIEYYDENSQQILTDKEVVFQETMALENYQNVCRLLNECKAYKWDGYHKANSNVLDGYSFDLCIELIDGKTIQAYGNNALPKNFNILKQALIDLTSEK